MKQKILLVLAVFVTVALLTRGARSQQGLTVWANNGEDKVTRDDMRVSGKHLNVANSVWDGVTLKLRGARNETVEGNLVLEAPAGASGVSVAFNRLTGPGGAVISSTPAAGDQVFTFVNRNIELFYVRYLQITGLSKFSYESYDERHVPARMRRPWSGDGFGSGGWADRPDHDKFYPDIAVPIELVPSFNIAAGTNQSIYIDIFIPKTAPAGLYQGAVTIQQAGGATSVPVELTVYPFTLPETPSAKTMLYFSSSNLNHRFTGSAYVDPASSNGALMKSVRDRLFLLAHRHRISLIGDDINDCGNPGDQPCPEWLARLNGTAFTSGNGYDGPGVAVGNGVYSIGTYSSWSWKTGGQSAMNQHTDAWANWFAQNAPGTEVFLYLIDESPNYPQIETWAQWMAANTGPGHAIRSMATIGLPTAASNTPSLDIPTSTLGVGIPSQWEPLAAQYSNDARKRFYMYNGHRPATGSFATEDDGVALRELVWAQFKKAINRWFFWESTYFNNYQWNTGETDVFTTAQTFGNYASTDSTYGRTGGSYNNGEGVLFYPGTDRLYPNSSFNVNGSFASLRLKHWRRGIQDYEYLTLAKAINPTAVQNLVNTMVPKALWEYGVSDPSDPTWVRTDISWSVNPDDWEQARAQLAAIITGQAAPTLTSLSPASGAQNTAPSVTLTGTNFTSGATVNVSNSGITVSNVVVASPTQITATFTIGASATGSANVTVTTGGGTSSAATFTVSPAAAPGQLTLVTPLSLTPAAPAVGQTVTAAYTVQNTGGQPVTVQYYFVAGRTAAGAHVDFPVTAAMTLQPGQSYSYQGSESFAAAGTYTAWPDYYDGTNWIDLAPTSHTTFQVSATTTRIEENNPAVVFGPGPYQWNTGTDSRASGGGFATTAAAGATATLAFTGTGLSVIGILDSCSGQAQVTIDGVTGTFDAYRASGGGWQQTLYSVTNLAAGSHSMTLTVLGTKQAASCGAWIYVDGFDVIGGGAIRRIEQNDPSVTTGPNQYSWNTGSDSRASGGSVATTATAGSTMSLNFTGTGVSVIGILDSCSGQANVTIDGVMGSFDAYRASGGGWQQTLYTKAGLPSGPHSLTLTVLGTKQAASCGAWIYIDAFDVQQ